MRKQLVRFIVWGCASIAPAFSHAQSAASLSAEDREIVVLALNATGATGLLVDSTAPVCGRNIATLCIRRDMLGDDVTRWDFPDAAAIREAFLARNETTTIIGSLEVGITTVPRARVETMFGGGRYGWPDLQRTYPGARHLTQVSTPAYSSDANRALIYVETICDGRCGGGALLLFERRSGRWVLARELHRWIG